VLSIRTEQLEAFQPAADAALEARVVEYLREEHAEEIVRMPWGDFSIDELPEEVLLAMVREGFRRARRYGLSWEATLTAFVVMMISVAPNFDEHPLIRRVLADEQIEPNARVERLWERTTDENWEAARENYDADAWRVSDSQSEAADAEFINRLAEYLLEEHAEEIVPLASGDLPLKELPDETLCELVRRGVARARGYGMTWESSLAAFVVQTFVMGPNFDDHPIVSRFLRDENIPPDSRLDELWKQTTDEQWDAAPHTYRVRPWNLEEN
jgi:hypothetical protein